MDHTLSFTLKVYKKDRRVRSGEKLKGTYEYGPVSRKWMAEEMADLRHALYRADEGWRLELVDTYKTVKSLMTGKDVVIPTDTTYCCDPSTERYWSM